MLIKSKTMHDDVACIVIKNPTHKDVSFYIESSFLKSGNITKRIKAIKHQGKYLEDMDGAVATYYREKKTNGMEGMHLVATVSFSNEIPPEYLRKIASCRASDFTIEYYDEVIAEVE